MYSRVQLLYSSLLSNPQTSSPLTMEYRAESRQGIKRNARGASVTHCRTLETDPTFSILLLTLRISRNQILPAQRLFSQTRGSDTCAQEKESNVVRHLSEGRHVPSAPALAKSTFQTSSPLRWKQKRIFLVSTVYKVSFRSTVLALYNPHPSQLYNSFLASLCPYYDISVH